MVSIDISQTKTMELNEFADTVMWAQGVTHGNYRIKNYCGKVLLREDSA